MRLMRALLCLLLILGSMAPALAASDPPPASADDLKLLSKTLTSDTDRADFLKKLNALIAAREAADKTAARNESRTPIAQLQQAMDSIGDEAVKSLSTLRGLPDDVQRVIGQFEVPAVREDWGIVALKVLSVLAIAILAESISRSLLQRSRWRPFGDETRHGLLGGLLVILRLAISAIPILVFAGVSLALMSTVPADAIARPIASAWVEANVVERFIVIFAMALFVPRPPVPAPFALPPGDDIRTAGRIRWLARIGCYGWATGQTMLWLGAPPEADTLLLRLVALGFTVFAIIAVLRSRRPIAAAIAGSGAEPATDGIATPNSLRRLRRSIADIWHIVAIIYLVGSFSVLMVRARGGFLYVLEETAISIAVLAGARLIVNGFVHYAVERQAKVDAGGLQRHRMQRYLQWASLVVRVVVWTTACVVILDAWGAGVAGWFEAGLGATLLATLLRIGATVLIATLFWELTSAAIERILIRRDRETLQHGRPSRARTLLPLLRNALFITLSVLVSLVIMGELGLNTGPLIAGASVIGVAVGLGAQQLVKDVITGLVMLVENQVSVGDSINLGSTQMGVLQLGIVEAISLRTIQLRDDDGALHTIPFSQVNAVINFSRDYAFYQISLTLPAEQDVEAVTEVLVDAADTLAKDDQIGRSVAAPIEIRGVESITATNYTVKARLKTLPLKQWDVGRAFNRLLQDKLSQAGIKLA